jgi:hypothetical protein
MTDGRTTVDGHEECRSEIDAMRKLLKEQQVKIAALVSGECLGTIASGFVACGERVGETPYYCSHICRLRAERRIT